MLFFLVSGFLIPGALKRGVGQFLLGRAFRLLPVYWAVMLLTSLVYHFASANGSLLEDPFTGKQILTNFLLINDLAWQPFIEAGVWTLVVEVKFYVLLCCVVLIFGEIGPAQIIKLALFLTIVQVGFASADSQNLYQHLFEVLAPEKLSSVYFFIRVLNENIPFIIFMLCGSIIWFWWSGKTTLASGVVYIALLLWLFVVTHLCSPVGKLQLPYIGSAFQVLACFCSAASIELLARKGWLVVPNFTSRLAPFSSRVVRFFASVSYPLYLLHGTALGWPVLILMVNAMKSPALVMVAALPGVFLVAWALHKWVEVPAIRLGRDLQGLFSNRAAERAAPLPSS